MIDYIEIPENEYQEDYISFEEKYYKELTQLGFDYYDYKFGSCSIKVNKMDVYIYQVKDNHFDVEIHTGYRSGFTNYYRCEHFDGLLKLLKDKKII